MNVSLTKIAIQVLPTSLRKPLVRAFVCATTTPLEGINASLCSFHQAEPTGTQYRLRHNGQVCYLRKALNDNFDPDHRGIKIDDGNSYMRQYIYTRSEGVAMTERRRFLGRIVVYPRSDYMGGGADFLVLVPRRVITNDITIAATVDYYRLAGMKYEIRRY